MTATKITHTDPSSQKAWEGDMSASELELLHEMVRAIRSLRYGSVVLTVHDGRLVEIQKTEKIRVGNARPQRNN